MNKRAVAGEGRGVRFLTDRGGQTEILGLVNYASNVPKDDLRPAFDVSDEGNPTNAGGAERGGNTFPVKVRQTRAGDTRTENGGGWIGWFSATEQPRSFRNPRSNGRA